MLDNQRVNRQPTLHEYSIYCCKLRLVEQDAIAYPIALCGPLNADFDGEIISPIIKIIAGRIYILIGKQINSVPSTIYFT